jgi:hypothetical protein
MSLTAPSTAVVPAWVWTDTDEQPFCRMQWTADEREPADTPALAVPLALFDDADFIAAVAARAVALAILRTGAPSGIPAATRYVLALAGELRHRAGVPHA